METDRQSLSKVTKQLCGLAFDSCPIPMWVFDKRTLAFLAVNDAAITAYGYSRSEFSLLSILDIRPPKEVLAVVQDAMRPHQSAGAPEYWRHQNKNGEIFDVELACYELIFENKPARLVLAKRLRG